MQLADEKYSLDVMQLGLMVESPASEETGLLSGPFS